MKKQPNLLFVFSDQHRKCSLGCYGDRQVRTPNLDRLAADGLRFDHCISNFPVCVPMRGSLLTGLYAWNHGAITNDLPVRGDVAGVADKLEAAGYHTGYIGKWHLGGIPRDKAIPAGERLGFTEWKAANCNHAYDRGYYFDEECRRHEMAKFQPVEETDLAIDFLRRNADARKPWALFLSWSPPHEPFDAVPPEFLALYAPEMLELHPNVPAALAAEARRWTQGYYGLITLLDREFGRLRDAVGELGLAEETLIVYTSDHGDLLGSHGLRNKQLPHEESIAVPLLAAWPGHLEPGVRDGLIGLTDLPVTLAGLLGIDWPEADGGDRSEQFRSAAAPGAASILISDLVPCHQAEDRGGSEWIGLRTARYTFARDGNRIPWLLFDNEDDPYQLRNLAGRPEAAEIERALHLELDRKLDNCRYRFRPWRQMVREDGYLERWNESQRYFNRRKLEP